VIQNRNLARSARFRVAGPVHIDLDVNTPQTQYLIGNPGSKYKIRVVNFFVWVAVATDAGTSPTINLIYQGSTKSSFAPTVSKTLDTWMGPSSFTAFDVTVATGVYIQRATGAATNTGEVDCFIEYQLVD